MNFLISLLAILLFAGCVSPPLTTANADVSLNAPSSPQPAFFAYPTRSSISCENLRPLDAPRQFPLPLAGYLVGPTAARIYPKLKQGILRPFTTDGCSFAPDGNTFSDQPMGWVDCCIHHDAKYWLGGSREDRRAADAQLQKCIGEKSYGDVAKLYARVVAKTGTPDSAMTYRWGYGWNYKRPYAEIRENEDAQVQAIYGVDSDDVAQKVFETTTELVKYCDAFDSGLREPSAEEQRVYNELNKRLQKDDVIEWSRWRRNVLGRRRLEVKLKNCLSTTIYTFALGKPDIIAVDVHCL